MRESSEKTIQNHMLWDNGFSFASMIKLYLYILQGVYKKVATVTAKGVVKGLRKGTATITVKSGSKKMICKVTVK